MDMTKFRNSLKSSIAGASLATIVACGGGGSNPQPTPPQPTVTTTSTMSAVRNRDNPGAAVHYTGDRLESDVAIDVVTKNFTGTPAYVDNYRIAHDAQTLQLYLGGNASTIRNTIDWVAGSYPTATTLTPKGDIRVYNTTTSQFDQALFTYTTATHTIAPAPDFIYQASVQNPHIIANIDEISSVSSRFTNSGNGATLTPAEWKSIYTSATSGVGTQILWYDVDFTQNTLRLPMSNNTQSVWHAPTRKDMYDLQKAYTK